MTAGQGDEARDAPMASGLTLALSVVLPFGAGYFLANLLRTLNAIIAPRIAEELQLSAADLGLLTSVYFIAFAAAQLPVGVALDRWGARRVAASLLTLGALGMIGFALARSAGELTVARAMIGLGVSGCLMAALKANSAAWPAERLPFMNGLTAAMGMLGSIASTLPVELAMAAVGWRGVLLMLGPATLLVAVAIHLLGPRNTPVAAGRLDPRAEIGHIAGIWRDPRFLWLALPATIHTGTYLAYQSLWAGPWLRDVAALDSMQVATALFAFNVGMLIGTLGSGWAAERLARLGVPTVWSLTIGMAASLGVQLLFVLEVTAYPVLLCLAFGLFCSTWFLVYSVLARIFERKEMGRVNTLLNMMIFVTAFAAQWAIGAVIGAWPSESGEGFSREGHRLAFALLLALEVIGLAWLLLGRPKSGRQKIP